VNLTEDRFTRLLRALIVVAMLALVFCVAAYLVPAISRSQAYTGDKIHTAYRNPERVQYHPVETMMEEVGYEPVEMDVVENVEIPRPLRYFHDFDELEEWLKNIPALDTAPDADGKKNDKRVKPFDCDDYAMKLQEKALNDGYIMSFEVIHPVEYNAIFKQKRIPTDAIHAINLVIIGNEIYYVEPQTREIVFVAYLD